MMTVGILFAFAIFGISYFLLDVCGGQTALERRSLHARIDGLHHSSRIGIEKRDRYSDITALNEILKRQKRMQKLNRMLEIAGWGISASVFILVSLFGAALIYFFLLSRNLNPLFAGAASAVSLSVIPMAILKYKYLKYMNLFTAHFPKALQIIRGALGAGLGLSFAFERVASDAPYPVNKEFKHTIEETTLGKSLFEVIASLYKRIPTGDVQTFYVAISVQQESGGNLSELMTHLEETITARVLMRREIKALTAMGRLSGWILISLPFALFLAISRINPGYFEPLFETDFGERLIIGCLTLGILGVVTIIKLVNIKIAA